MGEKRRERVCLCVCVWLRSVAEGREREWDLLYTYITVVCVVCLLDIVATHRN